MKPEIVIVAAMGRNREIGKQNELPWKLPSEMKHFKNTTLNSTVLMGRLTADSLGKALPQRMNLVMTRYIGVPFEEGCETRSCKVFDAVHAITVTQTDKLHVIGGAQIYELFLPMADRMVLSHLELSVEGADAFFPQFDPNDFDIVSRRLVDEPGDQCAYTVVEYVRRRLVHN